MEAFIILLIFAGTIVLIVSPFFERVTEVWETAVMDSRLNKLNAVKDSYYKAIKDVDFENAEGKLSEKDYNELRGYYKEKAIMTIKEIEKIKVSQPKIVGTQQSAVSTHKKGKKEHR
ncbi:MAG: hypothetical protein Q7T53_08495 [Deltaproteobacteria bacterium]|nr:hypothetical protein [Deltaproteobacteria bacterium]